MLLASADCLRKQVRALRNDFEAKLAFLELAATRTTSFKEYMSILEASTKGQSTKDGVAFEKKARRGLRSLELASLLESAGAGRRGKRYRLTDIGFGYLVRLSCGALPTVGSKRGSWSDRIIAQSLKMDLGNEITATEANETAKMARESMIRLAWGNRSVGRQLVRQLCVEALKEMGRKYHIPKYYKLARMYEPIGGIERAYDDYTKHAGKRGVHRRPPEDYARKIYMLRKIERYAPLLSKDCEWKITYIHGLLNAFKPFNFNHDMRILLSQGIQLPHTSIRPARHFDSALECMLYTLCLSQVELAGSQNLDHWNYLLAPYAAEMTGDKELGDCIESFINKVWMNYAARPRDPLHVGLTLEFGSDCSLFDDPIVNPASFGTTTRYSAYEEEASRIGKLFIQRMASYDRSHETPKWYPSIFLKLSSASVGELDDETLTAIMNLLLSRYRLDVPQPLHFVNSSSQINQEALHVSYFSELARIPSLGFSNTDLQRSVLTFISVNFLQAAAILRQQGRKSIDLLEIPEEIEQVLAQIVVFSKKKYDDFKGHLLNGEAGLLSIKEKNTGEPYFRLDSPTIHVGLCYFNALLKSMQLDLKNDVDKVCQFLQKIKIVMNSLQQNYSTSFRIELAQSPSRSGLYTSFWDKKPPFPFDCVNLTSSDFDRNTQLAVETKLHRHLLGGAISRVYLNADENIESWGFDTQGKHDSETFRAVLRGILKSSDVGLFQMMPRHKSASDSEGAWQE